MNHMNKTPTKDYLNWRANLKPGYYWIENTGFDEKGKDIPIRRILDVIEIKPDHPSWDDKPSRYGYWRGELQLAGLYVLGGKDLTSPEHYADWQGFRAEPVKPPSFLSD